jgi:hypothetical protein
MPDPFLGVTLRDNFNRANETAPMTGWTDEMLSQGGSGNGLDLVSNGAVSGSGVNGIGSASYWNGATFGPHCGMYVTVSGLPNASVYRANLVICGTNHVPGSGLVDCYEGRMIRRDGVDNDEWQIICYVGEGIIAQSVITKAEWINGDKLGMRRVHNQVEMWAYTGGAWVLRNALSDETWRSGYCGMLTTHLSTVFDDFSAGNLDPSLVPAQPKRHIVRSSQRW